MTMLTSADRRLLELAARAVGYLVRTDLTYNDGIVIDEGVIWNPLDNDGSAFRLAVMLANTYDNFHSIVWNWTHRDIRVFAGGCEGYGRDPREATRRAIVIAAAEIGKAMKDASRKDLE